MKKNIIIAFMAVFVCLSNICDAMVINTDYEPTAEEISKAENAEPETQAKLGALISRNAGAKANEKYQVAMKLLRKAAEKGNASAQSTLGFLYHKGHGGLPDDQEAAKWWKKSIENGLSERDGLSITACELGKLYLAGYGVEQSYEEAAKWFQKGATGPWAQYELGKLYLEGRGMPQDYSKAYYFLKASSMWSIPDRIELSNKPLQRAAEHLTPEQRTELDKEAEKSGPIMAFP